MSGVDQKKPVTPINDSRMQERDFSNIFWTVTAFENTEPEDMLEPSYWASVAPRLRPYDEITARANDGTWYARFLVKDCSRNWAIVQLLEKHSLTTADVSESQAADLSGYAVKHRGPHCKWSVIRISDKQVVHEGEQTKDGAQSWLREHLKAIA